MEILRSAIEYIEYLEELLQGSKSTSDVSNNISLNNNIMVSNLSDLKILIIHLISTNVLAHILLQFNINCTIYRLNWQLFHATTA